jgi:hypothetical protein
VSIKIWKLHASLSAVLWNCAREVFEEYFRPHIVEGAACTEAGDQTFRVHLQCMFLMMISSSDDVEER